jgi:hypothetical protein
MRAYVRTSLQVLDKEFPQAIDACMKVNEQNPKTIQQARSIMEASVKNHSDMLLSYIETEE